MNQSQPKRPAQPQNDSLIEQLRDLGKGVTQTITHDVVGGIASDAMSSLFGTPKSGDMQPGQAISLGAPTPPAPEPNPSAFPRMPMPERMPFPFPFKKKEQFKPLFSQEQINRLRQQEAEVTHKIEEIRMELKALVAEIKEVSPDIQTAVNGQLVDPDIYHMSFFDRIKTMLQNALLEIKNSRNWLGTQKSKKKQMGYWNQYKKKGTTFGLSHERTVATQVG